MSDARLLIDIEILEFLRTLRSKEQTILLKHFREMAAFPTGFQISWNAIPLVAGSMFTFSASSPTSFGTTSPTDR